MGSEHTHCNKGIKSTGGGDDDGLVGAGLFLGFLFGFSVLVGTMNSYAKFKYAQMKKSKNTRTEQLAQKQCPSCSSQGKRRR